jgi:hypothetical protein
MSAPTQWTPPPTVPSDGWNNNEIARRARRYVMWALGVLLGSWIVASSLTTIDALGVLVSWVGGIVAVGLAIAAVAAGATGVSRANKLGGYNRGPALLGLVGGVAVVVIAPGAVLLGTFQLIAWS